MSKYGWGWIWKSWFSPIGILFRAFGYKPSEDIVVDPDEVQWYMSIVPVPGYGAKELVKHGQEIFNGMFTKEEVTVAVNQFLEDTKNDSLNPHSHLKAYCFGFTLSERDIILKRMEKATSWRIAYDEYKRVHQSAESQAEWIRSRGRERQVILDLLQKSGAMEKYDKTYFDNIIKEAKEEAKEWDCCDTPQLNLHGDGDKYCRQCGEYHGNVYEGEDE